MKVIKWFIKWCLFFPIALAVLGTELNKAYWDFQVRRLCNKDGGVTVYESVVLTPEQYKKNEGNHWSISVLTKDMTKPNHDFYWKRSNTVINKSSPNVTRSENIIVRKSDEKELAKSIYYSRQGGDFPTGLIHPSSFSCLNMKQVEYNIERRVFLTKGE